MPVFAVLPAVGVGLVWAPAAIVLLALGDHAGSALHNGRLQHELDDAHRAVPRAGHAHPILVADPHLLGFAAPAKDELLRRREGGSTGFGV